MTTLENSYCVPKTDEWRHFEKQSDDDDIVMKWGGEIITASLSGMAFTCNKRKEIPVQHFIDLVEDRPSTWRIKEYQASKGVRDGFWNVFYISQSHLISVEQDGSFNLNGRKVYLNTFTELLTLIKFLTPPTK